MQDAALVPTDRRLLRSLRSLRHVRSRFAFVVAAAVALPAIARAQAGTSTSVANVGKQCSDAQSSASSSAVCPTTPIKAGEGSAASASDNVHRAAIAAVDLVTGPGKKNGDVNASSMQFSELFINGAPSVGSQLIFHFRTKHDGFVDDGNKNDDTDEASWQLALFGDGGLTASVTKTFFSDVANPSTIVFDNAIKTAHGFDLVLPFTATGIFDYSFLVSAEAVITKGEPEGTELSASLLAHLKRIEAVDANGNTIAKAHFDRTTGFASIDLISTPEPMTGALVATGLVGVGFLRRRRIAVAAASART